MVTVMRDVSHDYDTRWGKLLKTLPSRYAKPRDFDASDLVLL